MSVPIGQRIPQIAIRTRAITRTAFWVGAMTTWAEDSGADSMRSSVETRA